MLGSRGVPSLQSFSNAKRAFVNDARIIKIYAMVEWPRMFRNVWSISTCFDIPDVFFLTSFKTPAGFAYITPITIGTGYYVVSRAIIVLLWLLHVWHVFFHGMRNLVVPCLMCMNPARVMARVPRVSYNYSRATITNWLLTKHFTTKSRLFLTSIGPFPSVLVI